MAERLETFVDGFDNAAGPWQTVLNGTPIPPYNHAYGTWGNLPGGASIGGYFAGHERRRIVKVGMQWESGSYDGTGLVLQFAEINGPGIQYAPEGTPLDCAAMGLPADGVYREYVFPTPLPGRGILWFKGFDDYRIPFNGVLHKIRVFTDDWSPTSSDAQGTVRSVAPTGSGIAPGLDNAPGGWQIMREDGSVVAYRANPNDWKVGWNGTAFVVKRPLTAPVADDYQLFYTE